MAKAAFARSEDIYRHLEDLRSGAYEGARGWDDRVAVFRRAVQLLDPVVRGVLTEASTEFLYGAGTIRFRSGEDSAGGVYAHWEMTWRQQREAPGHGGRVDPIQVMVVFRHDTTHPHLRGAAAGMWPCQVVSEDDARRQEPVIRAIVEAELHERIAQGSWQVIPAFADSAAGSGG